MDEVLVTEKIALAHYFYYLKSKEESFRATWAALVSAWNLKEDISPGELKSKVQSGQPSVIASVASETIKMKCVLFKDIIAIGVFFSSPNIQPDNQIELWLTHLQTIDQKRKELADRIGSIIGETTVLVSSTADFKKTSEQLELVFPQAKLVQTEIKNSLLIHLAIAEKDKEDRHYYSYLSDESSGALDFLIRSFLAPDVLSQIVQRKADFYFKQSLSIKKSRTEVDRVINDILHRPAAKIERTTIGLMEGEVEKLSSNFTGLANNVNLLKQGYTETEREIEILEAELARIGLSHSTANGFYTLYITPIKEMTGSFQTEAKLQQESLHNAKTAVDIIRTQVELARGGQSLFLQEGSHLLMVAGGFIEFIMVFYYTLNTWNILIGAKRFENLAAPLRFLLTMFFAASMVAATYYGAESFKEKHFSQGLMYSLGAALGMLVLIIILTTFFA